MARKVFKKRFYLGIAGFAVAILSTMLLSAADRRCVELEAVSKVLELDVDSLAPGEAKLFCYRDRAGDRIRFLLARGSGGEAHTVLDACRQCARHDKGYDVVNGKLVCRYCGNEYPIDRISSGVASCVPIKLPHYEAEGSRVKVRVTDLESNRRLF